MLVSMNVFSVFKFRVIEVTISAYSSGGKEPKNLRTPVL